MAITLAVIVTVLVLLLGLFGAMAHTNAPKARDNRRAIGKG